MARTRRAVALAYGEGDPAPRIVAAGRGERAERILQLAEESGVFILEEAPLAELLEPLGVGAYVPESCWEAVARVLAFVIKIEEGT
jgi:flagellar biosynthesis protein